MLPLSLSLIRYQFEYILQYIYYNDNYNNNNERKKDTQNKHSLDSIMSMNIFRLAGDMSHVFSIIVLLLRLRVAKNAQGMYVR